MKPAIVHIGFPKTATSTVQMFLFDQHPEVQYLGRNPGIAGNYRDPEDKYLGTTLRQGMATPEEIERLADLVDSMWAANDQATVVWSDEGASSGSRAHR